MHTISRKAPPATYNPRLWSHLAIDFITDLPPSQNKKVIMVIVDRFSKSLCLIPLPKDVTYKLELPHNSHLTPSLLLP